MIRSIEKNKFVMVHLPVHETNYFYIIFKLRWHRGDMEKYLKYRCYYVATQ